MTAGDVYRALWRHRVFIVVLTMACVGAAWYASSLQTPKYEASALVRIQQQATSATDAVNALQASERLAQTYAEIIDSGALDQGVQSIVSDQISAEDFSDVTLSGRPVEDLELLWISARSDDRIRATIVANAAPRALRSFIQRTGTLRDEVVTLKAASTPASAVEPRTSLNIAIALVLGLIFNSALALLTEVFRDRLPAPEELAQAVGYPVLATIPTLRPRRRTPAESTTDDADTFDVDQPEDVRAHESDLERPHKS